MKKVRFKAGLLSLKSDFNDDESEVKTLLVVTGEWLGHPYGAFKVDSTDLLKIKNNFDEKKIDLVIDYEHQSLYGGEAPAAGWITDMLIEDDKLYGMVSWTKKAREYIKNREYRYLSPVLNFNGIDKKSGVYIGCSLESVALTNTPFLDELDEVRVNKNNFSKEGKSMPDNEVLENKANTQNESKEEIKSASDDDKLETKSDDISALKDEIQTLKSENSSLRDELASSNVEAAIFANKITPNQKAWALSYAKKDLEGFKEFIKNTGAAVKTINVPQNNIYANKSEPGNTGNENIVSYALEHINN